MTHDDYQQMRSMYADVDELCRVVEETGSAAASDESLRRLVGLFHDQQREPGQIRSFIRHLGAPDEAIGRLLREAQPGKDEEDASGIVWSYWAAVGGSPVEPLGQDGVMSRALMPPLQIGARPWSSKARSPWSPGAARA